MSGADHVEMDVKTAISKAKQFVKDTFADDGIINLGLEEIVIDEDGYPFQVTIGFSRRWDELPGIAGLRAEFVSPPQAVKLPRTYKRVFISHDGEIHRVENRETAYDR